MGCSQSAAYDKITQHPRFGEWMEKFAALQISKQEALKLYTVFHRADLDGGGSINLLELLTVVDLERTPFTKRVFSIFDDDESGEIDFGEFVLALWNYCTLSKVSLGNDKFLFRNEISILLLMKNYSLPNNYSNICVRFV